jgi:hypothetical protein
MKFDETVILVVHHAVDIVSAEGLNEDVCGHLVDIDHGQ